MCDSGTFAVGLALTQVSAGLLASALIGTFAHGKKIPETPAVAVAVATVVAEEDAEAAQPAVVRKGAQNNSLRYRNAKRRTQDSITIAVGEEQAKKMTFDF